MIAVGRPRRKTGLGFLVIRPSTCRLEKAVELNVDKFCGDIRRRSGQPEEEVGPAAANRATTTAAAGAAAAASGLFSSLVDAAASFSELTGTDLGRLALRFCRLAGLSNHATGRCCLKFNCGRAGC